MLLSAELYLAAFEALRTKCLAWHERSRRLLWLPMLLGLVATGLVYWPWLLHPLPQGLMLFLLLVLALYPLLLLVILGMLLRAAKADYSAYRKSLAQKMHDSQLAGRIAAGMLEDDDIWAWLPRWVVRRWQARPDGPGDRLYRVAVFINWYTEPPREVFTSRQALGAWLSVHSARLLALSCVLFGLAFWRGGPILTFVALLLVLGFCVSALRLLITPQFVLLHLEELEACLRSEWNSAAAGSAAREAQRPLSQMAMLLNQFENDLAGVLRQLVARSFATGVVFVLFAGLPVTLGLLSLWPAALSATLLVGAAIFCFYDGAEDYEQQIRAQLQQSSLALRLASGSLDFESIEPFLPRWPRPLLYDGLRPKAYGDDLRRVLWRIAMNLDWYLGPPRRFFRLAWLSPVLLLLLLPAVLGLPVLYAVTPPGAGPGPDALPWLLVILVLITLHWLPEIRLLRNRLIWSRAFVDYLRNTLGRSDDEDEEARADAPVTDLAPASPADKAAGPPDAG